MKTINRRQFVVKAAMGVGTTFYLSQQSLELNSQPLNIPVDKSIGFQIWPVREALIKDFEGTLRQVASMGYETVEMCSPPGYGFDKLTIMTAREMSKYFKNAGLTCTSCHYQFKELQENLDARMAFAKELGLKQMIVSSFGIKNNTVMLEWFQAADELNRLGERSRKYGIQLGYHNHGFEFQKIDGVLIYDALMQRLDPEFVKMQFQVSVIKTGYKAATYFKKYPGRFLSSHLSDWSPTQEKVVPVGQGVVLKISSSKWTVPHSKRVIHSFLIYKSIK
jgi:sugar phosphate isomerase/epimerase